MHRTASSLAKADIIELKQKIYAFKSGEIPEDKFKLYRLTRGVYGQRQSGVQMFRTKLPFGKITGGQLKRLAEVAERYTNGNLHLTTRQNIQLHYIKLEDTPSIWEELDEVGITARESCGNTVRNITGSAIAGIDPQEPFDITPYVQAMFEYFLRNPICQEMGRKIKIAFSSSENDSAFTYFHDFGFIPRIQEHEGRILKGFKVLVGGGLGAQSIPAITVDEFMAEDKIIPFVEATLRVFDRYGEREKRHKARMKFLVSQLGLTSFMELVEKERTALPQQRYPIDSSHIDMSSSLDEARIAHDIPSVQDASYLRWRTTNVIQQKQDGFYAVYLRIPNGNLHAQQVYALLDAISGKCEDELRITVQQGLLLRFVREENLYALYQSLQEVGLASYGANGILDITACPGTDTCNLAVTNSSSLSEAISLFLEQEYDELVDESDIQIKISGCMNACGQHMAAQIGFHGSSIKKGALVIPAMQVVLGGGVVRGKGFIAEKIIKLPSKRILLAIKYLLDDYLLHRLENELFNDYVLRAEDKYFYSLLKPLADTSNIQEEELRDWGMDNPYEQAIGVGECAGVSYDMVASILEDALQKLILGQQALQEQAFTDSVYHAYSAQVVAAKALLLAKDIKCNTHIGIIRDFEKAYVESGEIGFLSSFEELVLQINQQTPSLEFAARYLSEAQDTVNRLITLRNEQLRDAGDKNVIEHFYTA